MNDDFRPIERSVKPKLQVGKTNKQSSSTAVPFLTPDEAAAADDLKQPSSLVAQTEDGQPKPTPKSYKKLNFKWPPDKHEWLIIGIVGLAIVLAILGITLSGGKSKPVVKAVSRVATPVKVVPKPTTAASTLTGLPVAPSVNQGPVTGVMIENSDQARPQSGLSQAGVVFEAIAEGGITRFLALYQNNGPSNVGPIRSARPYYASWDLGFDAPYAHVGGSPDALADITSWGVKDLNEFYNANYYHRITGREAPHNVYTAISTLNQLEATKGYTSSTFTSFPRKVASPAKQPTAATVSLTLSGPDYDVSYAYDASTNSYNRSEGGAAMIDANTNAQISPQVVIAMVVPETAGALDATGAYYSDYAVVGSGAVSVFQDGTLTTGTWSKTSNTAQLTFTNASGQPLALDPGQTWITAVTSASDIGYQP